VTPPSAWCARRQCGAFVSAVSDCAGLTDCAGSDFIDKYEKLIDQTKQDVGDTLTEIAQQAPNAKIVLVGYPEILSRTVKCTGSERRRHHRLRARGGERVENDRLYGIMTEWDSPQHVRDAVTAGGPGSSPRLPAVSAWSSWPGYCRPRVC
jgi:hypothetical protein